MISKQGMNKLLFIPCFILIDPVTCSLNSINDLILS